MKYRTIIEYEIEGNQIKEWSVMQDPSEDESFSDLSIVSAISLYSEKKLFNCKELYTFDEETFYEYNKKIMKNFHTGLYLNQLERIEWEDIKSIQDLNIEN